jgi:Macrocin-O-methyltransferase (TylF)
MNNYSHFQLIRNVVTGKSQKDLGQIFHAKRSSAPAAPGMLKKIWLVLQKYNSESLTLCGEAAIETMLALQEQVLVEKIPGDFIEAGVWRGGMPLLMRAYLNEKSVSDRKVWLADSFCGLPQDRSQMQDWRDRLASRLLKQVGQLAVTQQQVEQSFRYFGLLDDQVVFLKGWFNETLAKISSTQKFALLRLDGDYYESTKDSLNHLYPKLSEGGFVIIDDYNLPFGCKRAVDEYRNENKIDNPLIPINSQSVYWRKNFR